MRLTYRATHDLAARAGAASLAALMRERALEAGKQVGVVLGRQNIDRAWLAAVLAGARLA